MKSSFCFLKMKLVSAFERLHEGTLDEYMALQLPVEIGTESVRHRDIAHGATKVGFYETLPSHRGVLWTDSAPINPFVRRASFFYERWNRPEHGHFGSPPSMLPMG